MSITASPEQAGHGRPGDAPTWPAWLREFDATLPVHAQFVLHGNIRDQFVVGGHPGLPAIKELVWMSMRRHGYTALISYDNIEGFTVHPGADEAHPQAFAAVQSLLGPRGRPPQLPELRDILEKVVRSGEPRCGFLFEHASRLVRDPANLNPDEHAFILACLKLSTDALVPPGSGNVTLPYNPVIWLAEQPGDLPAWLTAGNVNTRSIAVPPPVLGDRREAARRLTVDMDREGSEQVRDAVVEAFATESSGMTLRAMAGVAWLARRNGLALPDLPAAVLTYRLGVAENPWRQAYLRQRIRKHQDRLGKRVIGQPEAVSRVLDVLKRAAMGMSGAQTGRSTSRPRGVLFLAGATGVGKTELAKAIAELVYGDEGALLRFDMSEYSEQHAADRLIGSPPGYTGHSAGGQLTNAMQLQPFRVILFDEIEKAHPLVLDKFLQILEDGRLTDGQGRTTFFSESIIAFTSNLGVLQKDPKTKRVTQLIDSTEPFGEVKRKVREAVERHFIDIQRPELLNRIGDNVVVFDFIRTEAAARIFEGMLDNVLRVVAEEHGVTLGVDKRVREQLIKYCTADLNQGGRGIGNRLESAFVNPLARALFDLHPPLVPGTRLWVEALFDGGGPVEVRLRRG